MILGLEHNFIFIHLEKCGGTTVEVSLWPYLDKHDIVFGSSSDFGILLDDFYGLELYNNYKLAKHSYVDEVKAKVPQYNRMYKFSTVRNPIDMMVSYYFYSKRIVNQYAAHFQIEDILEYTKGQIYPESWAGQEWLWSYTESVRENGGFDYFISYIFDNAYSFGKPQCQKLDESVEAFNIKTLHKFWPEILEKCNLDTTIPLLNAKNTSPRDPLKISTKTKNKIKKHFADDYEDYGHLFVVE